MRGLILFLCVVLAIAYCSMPCSAGCTGGKCQLSVEASAIVAPPTIHRDREVAKTIKSDTSDITIERRSESTAYRREPVRRTLRAVFRCR